MSSQISEKIPVAVLGATGSVGQRFVALLENHPLFELKVLTASERSAGKPYREAAQWMQSTPVPPAVAGLEVRETTPQAAASCPLVFSALDAAAADTAERRFAEAGHLVVSNARSHRMDPDVPLMVAEVNGDHLALLRHQKWAGGILTNPNCSTIGLVLTLKPLADAFGLRKVHVVTLQAVSGAGVPGVPSMQILDNVVPFIGGEEEKLQSEPAKILGRLLGDRIEPHGVVVSAQCNRVPVIDGHTLCVSVEFERQASVEEVLTAWREFRGEPQRLGLPSAPELPVHVLEAPDEPQPRLHRDQDKGMAAWVGRLRPCPLLHYKYVTLSHNTVRGAAGGALLLAELAAARGLIPDPPTS
jgi:aspartate-semialdehyde dehydrogenase